MWPFSKIKEQQQTIFIFNQKITEQQKTINDLDEKIKRLVLGEINIEELNVKNNELKRKMDERDDALIDTVENTNILSDTLNKVKKTTKLTGLLERSICGFEYIRDNHNEIWVTADDEFLAELKAAVAKP